MSHRNDIPPRATPRQSGEPPAPPPEAPRPAVDAPYGVGVSQPDGAYADTAGRGKGPDLGAYQEVRPWGPQDGVDEGEPEAPADEPSDHEKVKEIAPPRDAGVPKGDKPGKKRQKLRSRP
jgi:hypothetical protein